MRLANGKQKRPAVRAFLSSTIEDDQTRLRYSCVRVSISTLSPV